MHPWLEKHKSKLIVFYIALLVCVGVSITVVLNKDLIDVAEKEENNPTPSQLIQVTLSIPQQNLEYAYELKNTDSVGDLLERLRDKENFWYEKINYTYGTELENINNITSQETTKWVVLHKDEDITHQLDNTTLEDDSVYELRLVPSD